MKLRKIGNSLGTTFSRDMLTKAGFAEGEELDVVVSAGEITIRPAAPSRILVEFTPAEAKALASGKTDSKLAEAALNKLRRLVETT